MKLNVSNDGGFICNVFLLKQILKVQGLYTQDRYGSVEDAIATKVWSKSIVIRNGVLFVTIRLPLRKLMSFALSWDTPWLSVGIQCK